MDDEQSEPDWSTLDDLIFANRKLELFRALRERHGYTLDRAVTVFSKRYRALRSEQPERFTCSEIDFWKDFYS